MFFSCAISVLHYIGAIHAVFGKIARVMMVSLGISAPESLSAAGNIFIGQVRILDEIDLCFLIITVQMLWQAVKRKISFCLHSHILLNAAAMIHV